MNIREIKAKEATYEDPVEKFIPQGSAFFNSGNCKEPELQDTVSHYDTETPQQIRWIFIEIYGSPQYSTSPVKKAALTRSRSCPTSRRDNKKISANASRAINRPYHGKRKVQKTVAGTRMTSRRASNGYSRYRFTIPEDASHGCYERPLVPRYPLSYGCGQEVSLSDWGMCEQAENAGFEDGLIGLAFIE